MSKKIKHIHDKVMKKYIRGFRIETKTSNGQWTLIEDPYWHEDREYRAVKKFEKRYMWVLHKKGYSEASAFMSEEYASEKKMARNGWKRTNKSIKVLLRG